MDTQEKLYTPKEVAELLRVDVQTVRNYIRTGKLKAVKMNKRTFRITESEISFLLKGEQKS